MKIISKTSSTALSVGFVNVKTICFILNYRHKWLFYLFIAPYYVYYSICYPVLQQQKKKKKYASMFPFKETLSLAHGHFLASDKLQECFRLRRDGCCVHLAIVMTGCTLAIRACVPCLHKLAHMHGCKFLIGQNPRSGIYICVPC